MRSRATSQGRPWWLWWAWVPVTAVCAWGPFTHQIFACVDAPHFALPFPPGLVISSSFVLGSSAPDAFKGIGLHDWPTAAALFRLSAKTPLKELNLTAFALGYSFHLAADYAGHYCEPECKVPHRIRTLAAGNCPAVAFLNAGFDHEHEFSVDAFLVHEFRTSQERPYEAAKFGDGALLEDVADAMTAVATNTTRATVLSAARQFDALLAKEAPLLDADALLSRAEMVALSTCEHARQWSQVAAELSLAADWGFAGLMAWRDEIGRDPTAGGTRATAAAECRIDALYGAHNSTVCV